MMAEVTSLEHPTLKVPYEILNKKFRMVQKSLDREASHVNNAVSELEKALFRDTRNASQISSLLGGVIEKLSSFKRKAEEATQEEIESGRVVKRRIDQLNDCMSDNPAVVSHWKRTRLDRLLTEYLLKAGFYDTAVKFAKSRKTDDLCNIDIFLIANDVDRSLANHDTSKCLAWCHENKSKLRKLNSTLEFNVRMQEFIELIKKDKRIDAVWHARKYFSNQEAEQLPAIQQCMALIAFPTNTSIKPYKNLLSESRWSQLIEQFRTDNLRLYQISSQSSFSVVLQAGLSALKTPHCGKDGTSHNPDCPVCQPTLNSLASPLAYAHCSQSRLVCHISGEPLNENNLPLMLPNGNIYGQKALAKMALENNGKILCPRSMQTFKLQDTERVFVM